jgi:hypothetical protein
MYKDPPVTGQMHQLFCSDHILCCHFNLSRRGHFGTTITNSLGVEASMEEESPCYVHVLGWSIRYHM